MNGKTAKQQIAQLGCVFLGVCALAVVGGGYWVYTCFRIDVPATRMAVLIRKTGEDISNHELLAPDGNHKGVQVAVLAEGRHFYNPYSWDWNVYPMVEVPSDKMGVRVRLYGDNLPYGHFVATKDGQKGVVEEVLRPGRYPINAMVKGREGERPKSDYAEVVELYSPVVIPAGFKGVVTNLAGPIPEDPNAMLVDKGFRGVQKETLDAGTYYMNPYMYRIDTMDCRSQRFNLGEGGDMGFPSKDGFWVSLDGIIEFRVDPARAAEVFVSYNEIKDGKSDIDHEIVRKVITPNARSFCRLRGSNSKGRDFIGGETRIAFQRDFQDAMHTYCEAQGIEIVQALITSIKPPQAIAKPIRDREVARQKLGQYKEQNLQQESEAKLAVEKAMILQKQELVQADQKVIQDVTEAEQLQGVAVTKAKEGLGVAERDLDAAKDLASAVLARKKAEAGIIDFQNAAEAAGWKKAVEALGGDGDAYARFVMYQKLAPSFRSMMLNTADSPLMEAFRNLQQTTAPAVKAKP